MLNSCNKDVSCFWFIFAEHPSNLKYNVGVLKLCARNTQEFHLLTASTEHVFIVYYLLYFYPVFQSRIIVYSSSHQKCKTAQVAAVYKWKMEGLQSKQTRHTWRETMEEGEEVDNARTRWLWCIISMHLYQLGPGWLVCSAGPTVSPSETKGPWPHIWETSQAVPIGSWLSACHRLKRQKGSGEKTDSWPPVLARLPFPLPSLHFWKCAEKGNGRKVRMVWGSRRKEVVCRADFFCKQERQCLPSHLGHQRGLRWV